MTGIQWTQKTWNPVSGCTRVSAGCDHCYAVAMTHRLEAMGQSKYAGLTVLNGRGERHFNGTVRCHEDELTKPLKWRKPAVVFVNSMSDLFHKDVPFDFIRAVYAVMLRCRRHTFQVLTKRPDRAAQFDRWMRDDPGYDFASWPLPNVWLGASAEHQGAFDARVPHLVRCPAAVRFLSLEPLLGEIDASTVLRHAQRCSMCGAAQYVSGPCRSCGGLVCTRGIHWIIVGGESGESGGRARRCDVEWVRSIVRQGRDAGVPVFVKQLGSRPTPQRVLLDRKGGDPSEWPEDLRVRQWPEQRGQEHHRR